MTNDKCPFGERLQRYWDRLTALERQMKLDEEALYSLTPQSVAEQIVQSISGETAIDAFCGAGGLAIGLARAGKRVTALDTSAERLALARQNAVLFGVAERIEFRAEDCLAFLATARADVVVLDPPWGGVDYGAIDGFKLSHFSPHGAVLLELALAAAGQVVMRLPRNFDFDELSKLGCTPRIEENHLDGRLLHYCAYFSSRVTG